MRSTGIPRHQALTAKRFPVAEPVLYCADEGISGTPFYVMGFVDGRFGIPRCRPNRGSARRSTT
jgi:aminoglycoside phosphotransferase (APT) family kinase protein